MGIGKFFGRVTEVVGIFLLVFLFIIIIVSHNSTVNSLATEATNKNLDKYPQINENYPFLVKYLNNILGFQNYASMYTYIDKAALKDEFSRLNITTSDSGPAKSIAVLNYHGTVKSNPDQYSISVETFKNHMFELKRQGYETVTVEEFYQFVRGEKDLPEKSFLLTFDDGIKETYYNVDPILEVLGYEATMFVISGYSLEGASKKYYMNKYELTKMAESGRWSIQAHSYKGHGKIVIDENENMGSFYANKMWIEEEKRLETDKEYIERVSFDIAKAKEQLEENFNKPVIGFALPFGDYGQWDSNYDKASKIMVEESRKHYNMVFYQFKPAINKDFRANYNNVPGENFYMIMRIPADSVGSPQALIEEMKASKNIPLPYSENFENKKRWVTLWGSTNTTEKNVVMTNNGLNGAMAYLDGSYLWEDYMYRVRVDEVGAQKITLIARFQNSHNYAACKFNNGRVSIINSREGEQKVLAENKVDSSPTTDLQNSYLGMSVKGDTVSCYLNDGEVLSYRVPYLPSHGGVGLRLEEVYSHSLTKFGSISVVNH